MTLRRCAYCGSELEEGALFCGTCGHAAGADVAPPSLPTVLRAPVRAPGPDVASSAPQVPVPEEADPAREDADPAPAEEHTALEAADTGLGAAPAPGAEPAPEETEPEPDRAGEIADRDLLAGGETTEVPAVRPEAAPPRPPAQPILPVPSIAATAPHPVIRAAAPRPDGLELFVLQFSTGESVTVTGDGLIGRAPVREPGEVMDQLVPLADAGRSVSKTHLAFGQENGRFWVTDRYSTNGTVLRGPGTPPQRLEPGRRYPLSRGSRIDIGDQFFVVS